MLPIRRVRLLWTARVFDRLGTGAEDLKELGLGAVQELNHTGDKTMTAQKTVVSAVATLSIMFAGTAVAQTNVHIYLHGCEPAPNTSFVEGEYGAPTPATVKAPAPNMNKQQRTGEMLKQQEVLELDCAPVSGLVRDPKCNPKEQARTSRMLKKQEALDPNEGM